MVYNSVIVVRANDGFSIEAQTVHRSSMKHIMEVVNTLVVNNIEIVTVTIVESPYDENSFPPAF